MADQQTVDTPSTGTLQSPPQQPPKTPPIQAGKDEMLQCVTALEAALLPCLPARELQAIDLDVERHARDFMEAAKRLQLFFISLQREEQPTKAEMLQKEISVMEEELKVKTELIKKQEQLIQGWKKELREQLDKHKSELEKV
uniref:Mediator of RNA polymerase II transcription subunit 28 n=1 Tax=Chenopodium quinoa TaxID=63459 RepID=A0A803M9I9_CHEQI